MQIRDEALLTANAGYVRDGLVCWLDGINNTRAGHDATSAKWEDLSGNGNDFANNKGVAANDALVIQDNSYLFCTNSPSAAYTTISTNAFPEKFGTYEIVFCASTDARNQCMFVHELSTGVELQQYANGTILFATNHAKPRYLGTTTELKNTINTFSIVPWTSVYKNGEQVVICGSDNTNGGRTTGKIIIGGWMGNTIGNPQRAFLGNIYSFRVYDRELTAAEIAHNAAVDRRRFGTGGTV